MPALSVTAQGCRRGILSAANGARAPSGATGDHWPFARVRKLICHSPPASLYVVQKTRRVVPCRTAVGYLSMDDRFVRGSLGVQSRPSRKVLDQIFQWPFFNV